MTIPKAWCTLAALWLLASPQARSAQVVLFDRTAAPGAGVVVPVMFASEADSLSGVQFDLQYDSSVLALTATAGDAARYAAKVVYSADLPGNRKRFLIIGLNQGVIPDGILIYLFVHVNETASAGVYPLQLSGVAGTTPSAESAPVAGIGAAITVRETDGYAARVQPDGVLNGASLLPGPVAPGEIITVLGAAIGPDIPQLLPAPQSGTELGGTTLRFDGTPAPIFYAARDEIRAVVPYGVSGDITLLEIARGGQTIAALLLPVAAAAPGVFALDGTGVGPGAILNQDMTTNSALNPAERGAVVSLFATGAGQTDPPGVDAQVGGEPLPRPLLPVAVQIGGVDAEVLQASALPDQIAGMLRIDCIVPAAAPAGLSVPVLLAAGRAVSQPGISISLK